MKSEDAYEIIGASAVKKAGTFPWDSLSVEITAFSKMCKIRYWVHRDNQKVQGDGRVDGLEIMDVSDAVFAVFKYNISLLDQAETKMRAMDLPEADHTEYKRSCSFRSVKFGSAGSPMCDVQRRDKYVSRSDEEVLKKIETIMANQRSDTTIVQLKEDIENTSFLKMEPGFNIEGLYCSQQLSYSGCDQRNS